MHAVRSGHTDGTLRTEWEWSLGVGLGVLSYRVHAVSFSSLLITVYCRGLFQLSFTQCGHRLPNRVNLFVQIFHPSYRYIVLHLINLYTSKILRIGDFDASGMDLSPKANRLRARSDDSTAASETDGMISPRQLLRPTSTTSLTKLRVAVTSINPAGEDFHREDILEAVSVLPQMIGGGKTMFRLSDLRILIQVGSPISGFSSSVVSTRGIEVECWPHEKTFKDTNRNILLFRSQDSRPGGSKCPVPCHSLPCSLLPLRDSHTTFRQGQLRSLRDLRNIFKNYNPQNLELPLARREDVLVPSLATFFDAAQQQIEAPLPKWAAADEDLAKKNPEEFHPVSDGDVLYFRLPQQVDIEWRRQHFIRALNLGVYLMDPFGEDQSEGVPEEKMVGWSLGERGWKMLLVDKSWADDQISDDNHNDPIEEVSRDSCC